MLSDEMINLLKEVEFIDVKEPETNNFTLKGSEWNKICDQRDISNKYFLREDDYYTGCVVLDTRGYLKLFIF